MSLLFLPGSFMDRHGPEQAPHRFPPDQRLIARNIRVDQCVSGHEQLVFQVGAVRLAGKKKGFLRLNFWKVLSCEKIEVDVYPPATRSIMGEETIDEALPQMTVLSRTVAAPPGGEGPQTTMLSGLLPLLSVSPRTVKEVEFGKRVSLRLHGEGGTVFSLESGKAAYEERQGCFWFFDSVRVAGGDGRHLETERLKWSFGERTLFAPRAYVLRGKEQEVQGTGLTVDMNLRPLQGEGSPGA